MPYITGVMRKILDRGPVHEQPFTDPGELPHNAGELNYVFTRIALDYIDRFGEDYQHYNDILGALEGAKLELYRRHVAPYEDRKIEQNGDVQRKRK